MYSLLTLILTSIAAAFAGIAAGWYAMRNRQYFPLKKLNTENETALIQLKNVYTSVITHSENLERQFKVSEAEKNKTLADFKIISDERAALKIEFNIYKSVSENKITALEAEIKKLGEAEIQFNKLSKEYESAIEETKILKAATGNLIREKQILLSEYGNLRTEASQKYNALKIHLDKLQNPYAAYSDVEEKENTIEKFSQISLNGIFPDLSESVIDVPNKNISISEPEKIL